MHWLLLHLRVLIHGVSFLSASVDPVILRNSALLNKYIMFGKMIEHMLILSIAHRTEYTKTVVSGTNIYRALPAAEMATAGLS